MASSKLPPEPRSSELTPQDTYLRRRELLTNAGLFLGTTAAISAGLYLATGKPRGPPKRSGGPDSTERGALAVAKSTSFVGEEERTPFDDVSTYNNFYEFGTSKEEPARSAHTLRPRPWSVVFDGEVGKPITVDLDTLMSWSPLEERTYRFRCVEAWSMVIPWVGLPLAEVLKRVEPTSNAKYVAFTTLMDPEQMPGQRQRVLDWPYVEGLRLDEAMHPLTLLAVGLYGKALPNQNGAPLRLVVPWKYGFKNIKSIVKVTLTEKQPRTTWNLAGPEEYGFYANVNPAVPHPRWSQASERRIGELLRRPTLPFNGYAEQVASLYEGLDPKTLY